MIVATSLSLAGAAILLPLLCLIFIGCVLLRDTRRGAEANRNLWGERALLLAITLLVAAAALITRDILILLEVL